MKNYLKKIRLDKMKESRLWDTVTDSKVRRRVLAAFMAAVLLLTSIQLDSLISLEAVASDPDPAPVNGIGVINTAYAADGDHNVYKVEFLDSDGNPVVHSDFSVGTIYIDSNGFFDVNKNDRINLLESSEICDFINTKSNGITQVKITFIEDGSFTDNPKDYMFYSSTAGTRAEVDSTDSKAVVYTLIKQIPEKDGSGNPVYQNVYDNATGEIVDVVQVMQDVLINSSSTDYTLSTYTSSELFEHEVNVYWHDSGTNRPTTPFTFTISQNGTPITVTKTADSPEEETSNHDVYKYVVPKYESENTPFSYTSELDGAVPSDYRMVDSGSTNTFTFYGQRTFDFDIKWKNGADPAPYTTSEQVFNYLNTYFELCDETNSDTVIPFEPDKVVITINPANGTASVSINGLDEITSGGTAKLYYLKRKNDDTNPIPLGDSSGDGWKVTADNPGIHSSIVDRVYQGSTLNNLKSGKLDFAVDVNWVDEENEAARKALTPAQSPKIELWRYANTGAADMTDRTAPADSRTVNVTQDPDTVTFSQVEKYDKNGYPYVYYAKETLTGELSKYEVQYAHTPGNTADIPANSTDNGGTITNKLAGTRVFTVEAEWKAAARQGGNATVVYQVQKNVNGTWVPVEVPNIDENGNMLDSEGHITTDVNHAVNEGKLTITDFKAETMTKSASFKALPEYDADGDRIEYKVVQVSVARTDNSPTPDTYTTQVEVTSDNPDASEIPLNGDKYDIYVDNTGDNYKFTYQLVGNMTLRIKKYWDDSSNPDYTSTIHDDDTVKALVKQFQFSTNGYTTYTDTTNTHFKTGSNTFDITNSDLESKSGKTETWLIDLTVPIYDNEGHRYQYKVTENNTFAHYSKSVTYQQGATAADPDIFIINNVYASEPGHSITLRKEWQDDGDLLHRKAMYIRYTPGATTGLFGTGSVTATLNDGNIWETTVSADQYYIYDSADFIEDNNNDVTDSSSIYTSIARIYNDYSMNVTITGLAAGKYQLLQKSGNNFTTVSGAGEQTISSTNPNYTAALTAKSPLKLQFYNTMISDWEDVTSSIAITSDKSSATFTQDTGVITINYAGTEVRTPNISGTEWINEVNSHEYPGSAPSHKSLASSNFIGFDNLVGIYKDNDHYYAVEQRHDGDGTVTFVNTRIGVVSYKIDIEWKVGTWKNNNTDKKIKVKMTPIVEGAPLKDNNGQDIHVYDEIPVTASQHYLTNLPKYDLEGRIIDWELEEIEIAGKQVNGGTCDLDGHNCSVNVTSPTYKYGEDSHSDDLISVKITNQFSGTTPVTINKIWYDDGNKLNMRSDTYIRIYRRIKGSSGNFGQFTQEFAWYQDGDRWSYTFEGLPKYDENGDEWEYAIEELEIDDYATSMYANYNTATRTGTLSTLADRLVPNGGTFVDVLYGEVVIDGKKLWENISSTLGKNHYPIAEIELYRRNKYNYAPDYKATETTDADKVHIGKTMIYNGDASFLFKPNISWTDDTPHTWSHEIKDGFYLTTSGTTPKTENVGGTNSLVLPRFDEWGNLITYSLAEHNINGYAFRISDDKIVNEYKGGRPVEVTVTKKWENMNTDPNAVFPTVTLTLYQIIFAKTYDEQGRILQNNDTYKSMYDSDYNPSNDKLTPVEYAKYEKLLTRDKAEKDSDGNWVYTFGKLLDDGSGNRVNPREDLRQYAPDGSYFAYYVTEKLSNYEHESVELNAWDITMAQESGNPYHVIRTSDGFLGTFYKANEIYANGSFQVHDDALGFKVKEFIQPREINGTDDPYYGYENVPIELSASIKNSYEPEIENFEGTIVVNKSWNNKTANSLNEDEYKTVKEYTFTVSRKTPKITSKDLFKIETYNDGDGKPKIYLIADSEEFVGTEDPNPSGMKGYKFASGNDIQTDDPDEIDYYEQTIHLNKQAYNFSQGIPITFRIYKTDTDYNKVEITGLAIYGQDAVRYTYTITEDNTYLVEYETYYKETSSGAGRTTPIGKQMTGTYNTAEFYLENQLKVFNLNLYKIFGKEYTPLNGSTPEKKILNKADYNQYFDSTFVQALEFKIYRKTEVQTNFTEYQYNGDPVDTLYYVSETSSGSKTYRRQFANLPKYDKDGNLYQYQIIEITPPGEKHYTTTYSSSSSIVGDSTPLTISVSNDATSKDTYVCNTFEAKQIILNKYWEDFNNEDGMRPTNVIAHITEEITDISQTFNIYRVLKNADGWTRKVELPKYYYNGDTFYKHIKFDIAEIQTHAGGAVYSSGESALQYDLNAVNYTQSYGYKLVGDTNERPLGSERIDITNTSDGDLNELDIHNKKDPVNSKLTFDKAWDDNSNEWDIRPDVVYVKLLRTRKDPITVTSKDNIIIPGSLGDSSGTINAQIRNLPWGSGADEYEYRIIKRGANSDPENTSTWETITKNEDVTEEYTTDAPGTEKVKTVSFTLTSVPTNETYVFRLQRKTGEDTWEDVTVDKDSQKLRVLVNDTSTNTTVTNNNYGTLGAKDNSTTIAIDSTTGVITIPADSKVDGKASVIIEGLPRTNGSTAYDYKVYTCDSSGTVIAELTGTAGNYSAHDTAGGTKAVVATLNIDDNTDRYIILKRSTDSTIYTSVDDYSSPVTVTRFFAADTTTGVVALPATTTGDVDNPKVVFEDLAYGVSINGGPQNNGTWSPYYYTTVECDKYGNDYNANWTCTSTPDTSGTMEKVSQKIDFSINLAGFDEKKTYINLRVNIGTNDGEQYLAAKDVTGKPIKVTNIRVNGVSLTGEEYYASSHATVGGYESETVLYQGVIVIPIPETFTRDGSNAIVGPAVISGTIENLPFGTFDSGTNTWTPYDYHIQRSKAGGKKHPNQGSTYHVDIAQETSVINTQPANTTVTVTKTWDESASALDLRPANVYYKIFRISDADSTPILVTDEDEIGSTGRITDTVSSNTYTRSFTLPNGKFVDDPNVEGKKVWKQYRYFVQEYDSSDNVIQAVTDYSDEQTKGTDKAFVLSADKKSAAISEGVKNTLIKRDFSVTKIWDDEHNDYESRQNLTLQLERKPVNGNTWQAVPTALMTSPSLTYEESFAVGTTGGEFVSSDNAGITFTGITDNPFTLSDIELIGNKASHIDPVYDRVKIDFSGLPMFNKDGVEYEYRVVETYVGSNVVEDNKKYLFAITNPHPEDSAWETSYVTRNHAGTVNYYVDHINDHDSSQITNTVVTNAVSYVHVRAHKVWEDEYNLYGKRPEQISFKLTRSTKTVTVHEDTGAIDSTTLELDSSFSSTKSVGEAQDWTVVWAHCAAYDSNGKEYEYSVEEIPIPTGYTDNQTQVMVMEDNGDLTKLCTITNTYVPPRKSLTLTKDWDDSSDIFHLRPTKVKYELCCRYDTYSYATGDNDDLTPIKGETYDGPVYTNDTVYSAVYESLSDAQKTVFQNADKLNDGDTADGKFLINGSVDSWTRLLGDLPVYVNYAARTDEAKDGSLSIKNGMSVPVTYYIREYLPHNNGTTGYDYTLFKEYGQLTNYPYVPADDIDASSSTHVIPVKIENLARKNGTGSTAKEYEYKLYTCDSTGSSEIEVTKADFQINGDVVMIIANIDSAAGNSTYIKVKRKESGADDSTLVNVVLDKDSASIKAVTYYEMLPVESGGTRTATAVDHAADSTTGVITIPNTEPVEKTPTSRGVFLLNSTSATTPELKLTNKLDTMDVYVAKQWDDNGYGDTLTTSEKNTLLDTIHYNVEVTLTSDSFSGDVLGRKLSGTYSAYEYGEQKVIQKGNEYAVKFATLPKYDNKGAEIVYKVWENDTNAAASTPDSTITYVNSGTDVTNNNTYFEVAGYKYGYEGSCKLDKNHMTDLSNPYIQYNIKNTLPLTAVKVEKTWDDQSNAFKLRPAPSTGSEPDPLALVLKTQSTADPASFDNTTTTGWEDPDYSIKSQPTESGNTWTYTYTKLLKYAENNDQYVFRISETVTGTPTGNHVNGYVEPTYVRSDPGNTNGRIIDAVTESIVADGTHPLTEKFCIQNALDTLDVYVTKNWEDNGYGGSTTINNSLHYNVEVTLTSNQFPATTTVQNASSSYSSYKYNDKRVIDKADRHAVKFENLPKYDEHGNRIVYKVWETYTNTSPSSLDSTKEYDAISTEVTNETISSIDTTKKYFDVVDRKYGYEGRCWLDDHATDTVAYIQYNILNTLPLTAVTVEKTWDDQNDTFDLRPESITDLNKESSLAYDTIGLTLKKRAGSSGSFTDLESADLTITSHPEDWYTTDVLVRSGNTWTYTYKKLLKYNESNTAYNYQIDETRSNNNTYNAPNYVTHNTTHPESNGNHDWDGTTPLTDTLEITNTLNTRDIIVAKNWKDNGYTGSNPSPSTLHYDIDITLHTDTLSCGESGRHDTSGYYEEVKRILGSTASTDSGVIFRNLPEYNKAGNQIVYEVKEAVASSNPDTTATADRVTAAFNNNRSSVTVTFSDSTNTTKTLNENGVFNNTNFVQESRKYGYNGSCKLYNSTDTDPAGYIYEITNDLPVAEFDAKMYWDDDNNRDDKRLTDANVVLSREARTTRETVPVDQPTDWDYIYFTDPHDTGGIWVSGQTPDPAHMKMLLKNGTDILHTITAEGSYVNNVYNNNITDYDTGTYFQNVYKFNVQGLDLSSCTNIVFQKIDNLDNVEKQTVELDLVYDSTNFRNGWGFYPTTMTSSTGIYECVDSYHPDPWLHATGNYDPTYQSDGREIYFEINKNDADPYYFWDDPHVIFYDSSQNVILQNDDTTAMGYIPTSEVEVNGHKFYSIKVPNNAEYFALNNGNDVKLPKKTVKTPIEHGKTYTFAKDSGDNYVLSGSDYTLVASGTAEGVLRVVDSLGQVKADTFHKADVDHKTDHYWEEKTNTTAFGIQILYNESNIPYTYRISESDTTTTALVSKPYTYHYSHAITMDDDPTQCVVRNSTSTVEDREWIIAHEDSEPPETTRVTNDGLTTVTFNVKNIYTPDKKDLTLEKVWKDEFGGKDYSSNTRPPSVKVKLKISYNSLSPRFYNDLNPTEKTALGLDSSYQGEIEISGTIADDTWTESLTGLPVNINPTGTASYNGQSYPITYSVEEDNSYGYTPAYTSSGSFDTNNKKLTVTNTLITQDIKVIKEWDDSKSHSSGDYDGIDYGHFDITGKITTSDIAAWDNQIFVIDVTEAARGSRNTEYELIEKVPVYKYVPATGTEPEKIEKAKYTIEELNSTSASTYVHYGYYIPPAKTGKYTDIVLDIDGSIKELTFTNKLPLTTVTVNKTWDDNSNSNHLRPDSIKVELYRAESALARDAGSGWEKVAEYTFGGSGNSWSHTFTDLLQYNGSNQPYYFKVVEVRSGQQLGAYKTTYAQANGELPATNLGVTNTLIKRDIQVEKQWDDSDYPNGENLHYIIDFTLKRDKDTVANPAVPVDLVFYGTLHTDKSSDTETITIYNVPVYDKNGNVITYTATESEGHYGYYLVGGAATTTLGQNSAAGIINDCVMKYTFNNKLPVTYLKVNKTYPQNSINETYHKYATNEGRAIKLNITRESNGNPDMGFNTANSGTNGKTVTYVASNMNYTTPLAEPLLVYDVDNHQYTYTVSEQRLLGYTPTYSDGTSHTANDVSVAAATSTYASPQEVNIRNDRITGDVKIQKIDYAYYKKHHTEPGYNDKGLDDVTFKLYVKGSNTEVPVKWNSAGYYSFDKDNVSDASNHNTVVSSTVNEVKGIIDIRDLPLNTYYLVEQTTISGYQLDTITHFEFTVDVNSDNTIKTPEFKSATDTDLDGILDNNGFLGDATNTNINNKLGNDEEPRSLTLTKVDKENESPLDKATYYLLYLIPYEIWKESANYDSSITTEEQYRTAAENAVKNSNGQFSNVNSFWRKEGVYQTDSSGNITCSGLNHGTYTFLEVQAPVGYEVTNSGFDVTYTPDDPSKPSTGVILLSVNSSNISCASTHKDPRRDARLKIFKQDEFKNPLNGAEFDLYYVPNRYEGMSTHTTDNMESDFDYIFFTDNGFYDDPKYSGDEYNEDGSSWGSGAWSYGGGHVYAYFFDDTNHDVPSDKPWPGVELTEYWINDQREGQRVYKVKPPAGAKYVVFNNNDGKQTKDIQFVLGHGYYKTGKDSGDSNKYTVNSSSGEYEWYYAKEGDPSSAIENTQQYDTYSEFICIKADPCIGLNQHWDDLHIYFTDKDGNVVGQPKNGYGLLSPVTIEGVSYYKFEIPDGATKFTINNGSKDDRGADPDHYRIIENIPITPYAGYQLIKLSTSRQYEAKIWAKDLNTTSPLTYLNVTPTDYAWTTPIKIATVVTGDDGLPIDVTIHNDTYAEAVNDAIGDGKSVGVKKWGDYYFKETRTPVGYTADNPTVEFTVGKDEADMSVYVVNANNSRILGNVELTKTAKEKSGNKAIGDPLPGAKFKLYKTSDTTNAIKVSYNSITNHYKVNPLLSDEEMTTDNDGKIFIDNIDWDDYYLEETDPPLGYSEIDPNTGQPNKVYFTIGRNNCQTTVQLSCKDAAHKAQLKITKQIHERIAAWGDPTFVFKIRQTHHYVVNGAGDALDPTPASISEPRERIVSMTLTGSTTNGSIGYLDIEPGIYEITEVDVSRYELKTTDGITLTDKTNITGESTSGNKATFTVAPDGKVTVNFDNDLKYYDKFSHVTETTNTINGYKGIRIEYNTTIPVDTDPATINKTALTCYKIKGDGTEETMTVDEKNALVITYVDQTASGDDPRFGTGTSPDFSDDTANHQIKITNPSRYTDGVYRLKATDSLGLKCEFDITFAAKNNQVKSYEKTITFKADDSNMTYFEESGMRSSQYIFTFIVLDDGGKKVYSVKHNGKVVAQGTESEIQTAMVTELIKMKNALQVNEAYDPSWVLDKWKNGSDEIAADDYSNLYTALKAKAVADEYPVTYTAILKAKS